MRGRQKGHDHHHRCSPVEDRQNYQILGRGRGPKLYRAFDVNVCSSQYPVFWGGSPTSLSNAPFSASVYSQANEMASFPDGKHLLLTTGKGSLEIYTLPNFEKVHQLDVSSVSCV